MIDEITKKAIKAISPMNINYLPASFDKRFGRTLQAVLDQEEPTLTPKQEHLLWHKVFRYRRQIGENSDLVKHAKTFIVTNSAGLVQLLPEEKK